MTRFGKYRELLTLAKRLEAEAETLSRNSRGRWDRLASASEYRARCEWMAGRIDGDELNARLIEAADVKAYPID